MNLSCFKGKGGKAKITFTTEVEISLLDRIFFKKHFLCDSEPENDSSLCFTRLNLLYIFDSFARIYTAFLRALTMPTKLSFLLQVVSFCVRIAPIPLDGLPKYCTCHCLSRQLVSTSLLKYEGSRTGSFCHNILQEPQCLAL